MIIAGLYPEAILSHRSALEYQPSPGEAIYLTHNSRKVLRWPGLTIRMIAGPAALEDDNPIYGKLSASSLERACLENLSFSRKVDGEKRTVEQVEIETRLIQVLDTRGESGLNALRDRAKDISVELGMDRYFQKLNKIISALLATQPSRHLVSGMATAMSLGRAYDSDRVKLFSILIAYLRRCTFEQRPMDQDAIAFTNMAFIESYFSNYIEGTTFVVEEAEELVFNGLQLPDRMGDSHDIKGTFAVCTDRVALKKMPKDESLFLAVLRSRHAIILGGRLDKNPGAFKTKANRAGSSYFVEPAKVLGTLEQGFKLMVGLSDPLARAIYMMFLVSEVHPFDDGNGRMARLMMNAELVAADQCKLIIPTVYREDYILNLKKLTRKREPAGFVTMMDKAHAFSHWLSARDLTHLKDQLHKCNAFMESDEAALKFPALSKSSFPKS